MSLFWLSDEAWGAIEAHIPRGKPGKPRVDDRRVISGILHVLKTGCRWRDVPATYGPPTTVYNRYNRWSKRRIWQGIFEKMAAAGPVPDNHRLDIFETPKGDWAGEAVTVFDANRPGFRPCWLELEPRPRLVMRVHKGDLLEADFGEGRNCWRVVRLEPSANRIRLVSHHDAGNYVERHTDEGDPFRWNFATYARLKAAGARRVRVDPIGRVSPVKEHP